MKDKRDECGCHRDCTVLPHQCEKPCRWPDCLTPPEQTELAHEVLSDETGMTACLKGAEHAPPCDYGRA